MSVRNFRRHTLMVVTLALVLPAMLTFTWAESAIDLRAARGNACVQEDGEESSAGARILHGREAATYLAAFFESQTGKLPGLKASHEKAVRLLAEKGYTYREEYVLVIIGPRRCPPAALDTWLSKLAPTLNAQTDYYSYSDGLMWFSSWDDGDDSTWEGEHGAYENTYYNYSDGAMQMVGGSGDMTWAAGDIRYTDSQHPYGAYVGGMLQCSISGCTAGLATCAFFAGDTPVHGVTMRHRRLRMRSRDPRTVRLRPRVRAGLVGEYLLRDCVCA
jgi:hypothetical protein